MPTFRLLHREASQGERSSSLSDFEYRVWTQYMLSADDFGVCPADAVRFQADNCRLKKATLKQVAGAIDQLCVVGLTNHFRHQSQPYLYQWDWQDWQKVKYPSVTQHPCLPTVSLRKCSSKTRALFAEFHPKIPAEFSSRGGARNANANANAEVPLEGEPERELMDPGLLWERWSAVAAFHGAKQPIIASPGNFEHLRVIAKSYSLDEFDRVARSWWESPHTGGRNLGLFRSQFGEVLEHLSREDATVFRAPRLRQPAPVIQLADQASRCPHMPECLSISACVERALREARAESA